MHGQLLRTPRRPGRSTRPRVASVRHLDPTAPGRVVADSPTSPCAVSARLRPGHRLVRPDRARRLPAVAASASRPRAPACATRRWRRSGSSRHARGRPARGPRRAHRRRRRPPGRRAGGRAPRTPVRSPSRSGLPSRSPTSRRPELLERMRRHPAPTSRPLADGRRVLDADRRGRRASGHDRRRPTTWSTRAAATAAVATTGPAGTYPHVLPPATQSRWRAHVGSFADQVYPLQALARGAPAHRRGLDARARRTAPRPRSAPRRDRPASGGGTTTPATAASSSATRSTASTSTRWHRWCSSTSGRPAATTDRAEIVAGLGWIDDAPRGRRGAGRRALRPGVAQGRSPRAAQGGPRDRRRHDLAVAGLRRAGGRPGAAAGRRSTTSAGPTSSAGCSTPGSRRATDEKEDRDA